jgi:hypothetical protein
MTGKYGIMGLPGHQRLRERANAMLLGSLCFRNGDVLAPSRSMSDSKVFRAPQMRRLDLDPLETLTWV